MGHRANFVVIKDGVVVAYVDDWAALGCVYYVTDGLEKALSELKDMELTNELLDWAFCEGGFLVDYDKSLLIVFGEFIDAEDFEDDDVEVEQGEDDVEYDESEPTFDLEKEAADARAFLEQIHPAWPGWTLRWDQRGADAFSDHLRARSLTTITTPAPSHPDDCLLIELAPGAA